MTFASTVEIDSEPLNEWHSLFLLLIAQRLNRERDDLPCGKDFHISRKVWMTSLLRPLIQSKMSHERISLCENGKIKKKWTEILWKWTASKFPDWDQVLWKGEENPFEKSASHYKSCSASFIQRVRQDIRSIVCWDLYLFTHKIWNCLWIQFLGVLTHLAPDVHLAEEQKARLAENTMQHYIPSLW